MSGAARTLLIGYGNPGRLDDGLGPALAQAAETAALPGLRVEADYQLTVEDAADVARHERVLFVDADTSGPEPFSVRRLRAANTGFGFSTHSVRPEAVLALARDLFRAEPETWLMGIRGYEFNGYGEGLSDRARTNLAAALAWVESAIRRGAFAEVPPAAEPPDAAPEEHEPRR